MCIKLKNFAPFNSRTSKLTSVLSANRSFKPRKSAIFFDVMLLKG